MKIKIDFVSPPFSGHLNPLGELALPLLKKNYDVRFITGFKKVEFLKKLGFSVIPLFPDDPMAFDNISNTPNQIKNNPIALINQLRQTLSLLSKIKKELYFMIADNKTDIVVADFTSIPAGIVSDKLEIPWITTIPSPFVIETNYGVPSYCGGLPYSQDWRFKFLSFLGRKATFLFKKIVAIIFTKELKNLNYKIYRNDGTESSYSYHSILGLGMREFEFHRDWPECFKFIGPCCSLPQEQLEIDIPFKNYKKSVFITLGTHLEWAKNKSLLSDVEFLASKFKNVMFVISYGRTDYIDKNTIYQKNNILAYQYIPYDQFLSHFDVVIHHGGAGITYNCIKYKKQSLVCPHDYDQFDFAARIEHSDIGIKIDKIKSVKTEKALEYILINKNIKNLETLNKKFFNYNPAVELENEINRLVNKNI